MTYEESLKQLAKELVAACDLLDEKKTAAAKARTEQDDAEAAYNAIASKLRGHVGTSVRERRFVVGSELVEVIYGDATAGGKTTVSIRSVELVP